MTRSVSDVVALPRILPILDPGTLVPDCISPKQLDDSCVVPGLLEQASLFEAILLRVAPLSVALQSRWIQWLSDRYHGIVLLNSSLLQMPEGWYRHCPEYLFRSGTVPDSVWGGSVHSVEAMKLLIEKGGCWAAVSPIKATASHPGQLPMSIEERTQLLDLARKASVRCYALGGMAPDQVTEMRALGFFGVSGIRAFWNL